MTASRHALLGLATAFALTPALGHALEQGAQEARLAQLRSFAAGHGDALKVHAGPYGMPRYISGALSARLSGEGAEVKARAFLSANRSLFPVSGDQLRLRDVTTDRVGGQHVTFEQVVAGVPVWKGTFVVHLDKEGVARGVTSNAAANLVVNPRPELTPAQALAKAHALGGVEDLEAQARSSQLPELIIYPTRQGGELVYLARVHTQVGPMVYFIDAHTGAHFLTENPMKHAAAEGTGLDVNGNLIDPLYIYQGRFFKVDVSPMFSAYIQNATKGANNLVDKTAPSLGEIYTFTSNQTYMMDVDYVKSRDNSFNEPGDPNHTSGVTAHDFFRTTLNFYKDTYNRNGIDNAGLNVSALVEVDGIPGYPLECNAGWLGYGYNFMMFGMGGDCFDYTFPSFTAGLDVIGHELNHGVDEFTINLGYNHESGALNEHFADVFGLMVENYAQTPNWLIGDDLFTDPNVPWTAFRSFSNPADPAMIMPQPDSMAVYKTAPVSYDAGGVHFNSGIPNRAFYLAVMGGTVNGVTVPKIHSDFKTSLKIAGDLWYDVMNSKRISAISQFNDTRDALIDSAEVLYPAAVNSIALAFQAVGVVNDLYPTSAQDATEPNDYPGLAPTLAVGGTASGKIWSQNDADIYAVSLSGNQTVTINLSGMGYAGRVGIYSVGLYSTLKEEAFADVANGTASFTFKAGSTGTYYVEVVPTSNAGSRTAPYTVSVVKS